MDGPSDRPQDRGDTPYALFDVLPRLRDRLRRVVLGTYPTPVTSVTATEIGSSALLATKDRLFIKREDLSASNYGGNKVRPLELLFGAALERGATRVWATGSLGSNHAVATAIHATTVGLEAGALLWPQPKSITATDNLRVLAATGAELRFVRSVVGYPWAAHRLARNRSHEVQEPGGAVPMGALGHLSAALELALQVQAGELPRPSHVVIPVGSTCTTAGILVGLRLAEHLGLGFGAKPPTIHAVRVTPWPVTDRRAILWLANRTQVLLASLGGPKLGPIPYRGERSLIVHGDYLGSGYARPTSAGRAAIARFAGILQLDTTYSAKAAAFALDLLAQRGVHNESVLLWATKSSAPLEVPSGEPPGLPGWVRRWLAP